MRRSWGSSELVKKVVTEDLPGLGERSRGPEEARGAPGLGLLGRDPLRWAVGLLGSRQGTEHPLCVVRRLCVPQARNALSVRMG